MSNKTRITLLDMLRGMRHRRINRLFNREQKIITKFRAYKPIMYIYYSDPNLLPELITPFDFMYTMNNHLVKSGLEYDAEISNCLYNIFFIRTTYIYGAGCT